ncbi:MAG: VOC family protein [Cyanobacteria bacterium P01_H01_bin.119]
MQPLINLRGGGPVDHLAICGPDTRQAAAEVEALTGIAPHLGEPEPGQFYWSASLSLGHRRFLEILGPNPAYRGFNPLTETVRRFDRLRPVFWYVGTDDFEGFSARSKALGAPVERIQRVSYTYEATGDLIDYTRGVVGPGFRSARPCVIQWDKRPERVEPEQRLELRALRLTDPGAERLRNLFKALGIEQPVETGAAHIAVDLDTPKGPITFEGPGIALEGLSGAARLLSLYAKYLLPFT